MDILAVLCATTVIGVTGLVCLFNGHESNFKAWLSYRKDLRLAEYKMESDRIEREDRLLKSG